MTPLLLLITLVAALVLLVMPWQKCVFAVFILVVIEGAIRKWVLPQANEFVYFLKDVVLIVAYVKYLLSREFQEAKSPLAPTLVLLILPCVVFCLLESCNFALGSPLVGIMGARNYLLYIPLMFLVRSLFRSQEDLFRFFRWYLPLSVPIFFLAIKQHFSAADSELNDYVWGGALTPKATIGEYVRATGTFSYVAGYGAYLETVAALTIPMLIINLKPVWKWVFRVVVVCDVAAMLLTGSRGPIIGFAIFLAGYFLCNRLILQLGLYRNFIPPFLIGAAALCIWFGPQVENLKDRFQQNNDLSSRITSSIFAPLPAIPHSGLVGFGAGATYQAAESMRQLFHLPPGTPIDIFCENEPERVMLELGPIGFTLWYGLRIAIIILLWQTFCRMRFPLFRELALTAFLTHLVTINGQMVFQITYMVYYWFLAGFILLLPELEKLELARWQARRSPVNSTAVPEMASC